MTSFQTKNDSNVMNETQNKSSLQDVNNSQNADNIQSINDSVDTNDLEFVKIGDQMDDFTSIYRNPGIYAPEGTNESSSNSSIDPQEVSTESSSNSSIYQPEPYVITNLKKFFINMIQEMSQNFTRELNKNNQEMYQNFTRELNKMNQKIEYKIDAINGEYAFNASEKSAGFIKVTDSKKRNSTGCGVLIEMNYSLYFGTSVHIAYSEDITEIRKILMLQLKDGTNLDFEPNLYAFTNSKQQQKKEMLDYLLIKVKPTKRLFSLAAHISNDTIHLGDTLRGLVFRFTDVIYNEGKVVEFDEKYQNAFQTDSGGTFGFSGSGYFNNNGLLKAIHKGEGQFLGESSSEDNDLQEYMESDQEAKTNIFNSIQKAFDNCIDYFQANYNGTNFRVNVSDPKYKSCSKKVRESLFTHARNPRTRVLDASLFYDLLFNTTGRTQILKQGQIIRLDYA